MPLPNTRSSRHRHCLSDWNSSRLAFVLLLTAAAPVSALSLSNFQLITSSSVPFNCILAYNQQLADCALSDFTQQPHGQRANGRRDGGTTCSPACQTGISLTQQTIKAVCSPVSGNGSAVAASSVLDVALRGDLVGLLCGGTEEASLPTSSTAAVVVESTAAPTSSIDTNDTSINSAGSEGVSSDEVPTTVVMPTSTPPPMATDTAAASLATNSNTFFLTTFDPAVLSIFATDTSNGVAQAPAQTTAAATDAAADPLPAEASLSLLLSSLSFLSPEAVTADGAGNVVAAVPSESFAQSSNAVTGPGSSGRRGGNGNAAPPSPTAATAAVPEKTQPSFSNSNSAGRGASRGGGSPFDAAVVTSWAESRQLGPFLLKIVVLVASAVVMLLQ